MSLRRDRLYYRLLEALDAGGCPICRLLLEDGRNYLDSVMYERVTDVATREEWRRSFGLCNLHTWQLAEVPATSAPDRGFAIIAADLLKQFENSTLEETPSGGRLGNVFKAAGRRLRKTLKRASCPACSRAAASESHHLRHFLDCLGDEDFRGRYEISAGICLPHFSLLAARFGDHVHLPALKRAQRGRARALRSTLEQFIERQDHRSEDGLTAAHRNAWKRALEFMSGKPGTFGNELAALRSKKPGT